ncbi:hypothetical protein [Rickettsia asembonensis]|nr:hypothetical protein [Rickettsia asembonensis]WCR56367.1 MAG: hypothetical protein PG979_000424 [Rickettsia asembonensis]
MPNLSLSNDKYKSIVNNLEKELAECDKALELESDNLEVKAQIQAILEM